MYCARDLVNVQFDDSSAAIRWQTKKVIQLRKFLLKIRSTLQDISKIKYSNPSFGWCEVDCQTCRPVHKELDFNQFLSKGVVWRDWFVTGIGEKSDQRPQLVELYFLDFTLRMLSRTGWKHFTEFSSFRLSFVDGRVEEDQNDFNLM